MIKCLNSILEEPQKVRHINGFTKQKQLQYTQNYTIWTRLDVDLNL